MLPFHQATSSYHNYMTFKSTNCSFRNAPRERQRTAQTLPGCWKERRDETVGVEQALVLSLMGPMSPIPSAHTAWPRICLVVCVTLLSQLPQGNLQLSLRQADHSRGQTRGWDGAEGRQCCRCWLPVLSHRAVPVPTSL